MRLMCVAECAARTRSSPGYILPVTTKFAGKLPLQQSIGIRVRCVRSKIIPKRDVPVVFPTARWAYIQVMLNSGSVRPEGLTSADTQIAFVLISQLS